ncbi:MAG TPA: ABC transporter permease [Longimicrobiaceae bacterium]|nr:ABC transporter permease [Longimicrobiaceae bacterium]
MQAQSRITEGLEGGPRPRRSLSPVGPAGRFLAKLGRSGENVARNAGEIALLAWGILSLTFTGKVSLREILRHVYWMGIQSLPIVLVTSTLAGVVTSQQGGYQFTGSVPLYILGSVVVSSVVLELGPVLTAVVLIGRVGARITAELGTMQVSEQIDALHSLGRDPVRVLAAPRVIAGAVSFPVLVAIANTVGILAGMVAARAALGLSPESFMYGAQLFWHNWDMFYSLAKGTVFGLVIPLIATHMGLTTRGGAEGVGRATTSSVVFMLLAVLFVDALFPPLLLQ